MNDSTRLRPDQVEALIQYKHDPGARGLHSSGDDTESRVELEAYVVTRDLDLYRAGAAA